jgi:hypothetical protein
MVIFTIVAGLTVFMSGEQRGQMANPQSSMHVPILTFGPQGPALEHVPEDWTHRHLVFSNPGTEDEAVRSGNYETWRRIVNDPRYIMQQVRRRAPAQGPFADEVARINELAQERAAEGPGAADAQPELTNAGFRFGELAMAKPAPKKPNAIHKDWNVSFAATGGTAPQNTSFPAKWSFNGTTASCADDFVIFPTGQAGSGTQASIIAYYNLYSGCGSTVPTVDWAYNTGGTVALSPVFSNTGSQIAFVQTSSSKASLVLLTFPLTPPGTGSLNPPAAPASVNASSYYNSGSGCTTVPCMTSITFSGTTTPNDTLSNPWYDYTTDSIYVGADDGTLHRFHPVFGGVPAEVTNGWPLALGSTAPSSPVYDGTSGCVYVGDTVSISGSTTTGGYLYRVDPGLGVGSVCHTSTPTKYASAQLDGAYGIRDAPLVDSTAQEVYVFVGCDVVGTSSGGCGQNSGTWTAHSGVYQYDTHFTSGTERQFGGGASINKTTAYQLAGTFDNAYFTSTPSSPSGDLYVCTTDNQAPLWQVPIKSNATQTAVQGPNLAASGIYGRCSPLSENFSTSTSATATGSVTIRTDPAGSGWGTTSTVTIGSTTYTFVTTVGTTYGNVLKYTSGNAAQDEQRTAQNLNAAITAGSTCYGGGSSCYYVSAANASVTTSYTTGTNVVNLTAKTAGTAFALSTNYPTGINVSGGSTGGSTGTDYLFVSVFETSFSGTGYNCSSTSSTGCVMSFNITTPSSFGTSITPLGTLSFSSVQYAPPTGGFIIDNALTTPSGTSQIYFLTQDTSGTVTCSGICGVQASQAAP